MRHYWRQSMPGRDEEVRGVRAEYVRVDKLEHSSGNGLPCGEAPSSIVTYVMEMAAGERQRPDEHRHRRRHAAGQQRDAAASERDLLRHWTHDHVTNPRVLLD